MATHEEPQSWQFFSSDAYVSVTYEDEVIGFCKSDFASRIVETLNEDERLRRALRLACYDLVGLSGSHGDRVDQLVEDYLAKARHPHSGMAAIATLLRFRQQELDVSDREFIRFCESYRLPQKQLEAIYSGEDIDGTLLTPLARILGQSVDELIDVLDGSTSV